MTTRVRSLFRCKACKDAGVEPPRVVIEVASGTTYAAPCPVCKEALELVAINAPVRMPGDFDGAPHVVIATTSRDPELSYAWHDSVTHARAVLATHRIQSSELKLPGGSIQYARNRLLSGFIKRTEGTFILYVDTDIGFDAKDLVRMVRANREVMSGAYCLRDIDWARVAALQSRDPQVLRRASSRLNVKWTRGLNGAPVRDGDLLEADDVGAGFLLLRRDAVERLIAGPFPKYFCIEDQETQTQVFEPKVIDGFPHTEDFIFARRWRELGGHIWVDGRARFTHWGPYGFEALSPLEQLDAAFAPAKSNAGEVTIGNAP
jgi:hypothetical protein